MAQIPSLNRRQLIIALAMVPGLAIARDAKWAKPLMLDGVPNLNQVDANLYRSAQPTDLGFVAAEKSLKIATVLNLRQSQNDTGLLKGTKIAEQSVPMNALSITKEQVIAALKLIKAGQTHGPVLVHCQHGADRTGVVIAMYRILYQGWTKEQAIDEMEHGGFNFHAIFFNIPAFIKNADIPTFKQALAIP